jgi:thymidylate synthase (FAD)
MTEVTQSAAIHVAYHPEEEVRKCVEAARLCYRSVGGGPDADERLLRSCIERGHESVIEHGHVSLRVVTNRGVSHEIVRHRIASYSQESQRYVAYDKERFGGQITFVTPTYMDLDTDEGRALYAEWHRACKDAESSYMALRSQGVRPETARDVLNNATKTELVMTTNFREWRHFFELRCSREAHPQMRELACKMLGLLAGLTPVVFDDLKDNLKEEFVR